MRTGTDWYVLFFTTGINRIVIYICIINAAFSMKTNESKYKQVVNHVIDGIKTGALKKGDWIPSINDFRKDYSLSRDTVFFGDQGA